MSNNNNNNNNNNNTITNIFLLDLRLRYFSIEVMSSQKDIHPKLCYYEPMPPGRVLDVQCYKKMIGSWVRIRKDAFNRPFEILTLCEVMVFGTKQDNYYIF